jgi:hypothetical protein
MENLEYDADSVKPMLVLSQVKIGDTIFNVESRKKGFVTFHNLYSSMRGPIFYEWGHISFIRLAEDIAGHMMDFGYIRTTRMVLTEKTWKSLT